MCLGRKEMRCRSGNAIGKWACAAERCLNGGSHNNPSTNAGPASAAAVPVSVCRKNVRGHSITEHIEAPVSPYFAREKEFRLVPTSAAGGWGLKPNLLHFIFLV
jgi:hypothetical protein